MQIVTFFFVAKIIRSETRNANIFPTRGVLTISYEAPREISIVEKKRKKKENSNRSRRPNNFQFEKVCNEIASIWKNWVERCRIEVGGNS